MCRVHNRHPGTLAVAAAAFLTFSAGPELSAQTSNDPFAPELSGLGNLSVAVTTSVPRAQLFFNQGMRLLYAFNHQESLRAFQEAARLDPQLAMAYWGQAMALGPNLNAPMTTENGRRAFAAVQQARSKAVSASPRERALVEALAARYGADGGGERSALDLAYASAMGRVAANHPRDPDVQTLYADALMNTMPWDYWKKGGREAKPEAATAIATLEAVIAGHPEHPGGHHYFIHAMEASDDPDRAVASADRLGSLMPSAGHMVHMPAHIYIRVGRYADAAEANVKAIAADEDYLAQCQAQGLYPITYYPHNLHFLWAAATLEGRRAAAIDAARTIAVKVPHHHAGALPWTADFPVTPLLAYARFGLWREILTEPSPPADQPYATGIWRYARGLAYVAGDRLDRAAGELAALEEVMAHEAFRTTLKDTPLVKNLEIASAVVEAELLSARGDHETAIRLLEKAVAIEDEIPYNEPPVWHQPPRQVLGAILLQAGVPRRAEEVYEQDLRRFRENGWSLFGLASALEAQGKRAEAASARERFQKAWTRSDITLSASRILRERAEPLRVRNIDLRGRTHLSYVEHGDPAGVPVVLLHGYTDSWRSFERVLPQLPTSVRAFAISQRGHGDAGRPDAGYLPEDFARDLAAFLDAKGVERAIVVGHSMGATVAQRFAIDFPERTQALVLVAPFLPRPGNAAVREFWESSVSTLTDPIAPLFVRDFQQSTIVQEVPAEFFEAAVRESLKVPARVWKAALEPLVIDDFSSELRAIRAPTLIVWGDRDAFAPHAEQQALETSISGSRLVVYAGVGHAVHWEAPVRFAEDLAAFVSSPEVQRH